jgi:hypothetical protein
MPMVSERFASETMLPLATVTATACSDRKSPGSDTTITGVQ